MIPNLSRPSLMLGILLLSVPASAQQSPSRSGTRSTVVDGYNLAFADADVRRVVDAVLGSMLGLEYSIDSEVQGTVTLRTNQPVPRSSLLPLLEAALRSVDAVVVVEGSAYRVLPRGQARSRARIAASGSPADQQSGFVTEVVTLRKASARAVGRTLEQFLGKDVVVGTDNALNQIIISGSGDERSAARELIARFDVDSLANMNFETYRLQNVDAGTLLTELERIFQPPFDIIGSRVRIVPLPRLRSVLAIAAEREDLLRIEPWIRRLDTGVSGKRKLYNYPVQNGRARDVANALQLVLGMGSAAGAEASFATSQPIQESPDAGPGEGIEGSAPPPASTSQIGGPGGSQGPRIVPNEQNNSLLIYADGEEYDLIREALDKIDQPVAQVLIEATLAEVTLTDDLRFGVDFSLIGGNDQVINTGTQSGTPRPIFPGTSVSIVGSSIQAVLNTLQSRTEVKVLSTPKLVVLNNQTATLQVGDQVPIVTQQGQGTGAPGAPIINSIELRDTGVILKVTPRVNDSGTITLDIAQEVSDVAETTTSGINSPTIQQRRITSTVSTRTGQMIALGGLIRDRAVKTKSGIPLLSQIPVIGGAFGREIRGGSRTELIILLTPTVIRSTDQVKSVVDALLDGLDATRPLLDRAAPSAAFPPPALPR